MKPAFAKYWRELADGTRNSAIDRLLLSFLIFLSFIYSLVMILRSSMFSLRIFTARQLPRPVVSIGNITVGGTGKTPVTAYIANQLLEQGYRVAVISRGYGGSLEGQSVVVSDGATVMLSPEECGDEPFLLASTVPGLIVVIGTDRYAAGMLAMEQLAPDIFLLDDGFQHMRLHRDFNVLLLDYSRPFGNSWTLPAGLLREPVTAARRADFVIRTRCPDSTEASVTLPDKPFCDTSHSIADCLLLSGGEPMPPELFQGKRLFAYAGIAEPRAFFDGLRKLGLNLVAELSLPDHVIYDDRVILNIEEIFGVSQADYAVTTEKDGVKLKRLPHRLIEKTLLARLKLSITNPEPLILAVRNLLQ